MRFNPALVEKQVGLFRTIDRIAEMEPGHAAMFCDQMITDLKMRLDSLLSDPRTTREYVLRYHDKKPE
jgi:hypothetical protein